MDQNRLEGLLARFPNLHLLVMGDYFLDNYLVIDPALSETSVETGLEAFQVVATRPAPGVAGTITNNLRAMGVRVTALGVLGDDGAGYELRQGLAATGVETGALVVAPGRMTPTYTKPMRREADGAERELNRLDFKNRTPTPPEVEREVIARLHALAGEVDGIVVSDQVEEAECGVITTAVRAALAALGAAQPDLIIAADSRRRIGLFRNVIVKPNRPEALAASGASTPEAAGAALHARTGAP
ncbi:MAG: PfkB family carbohydrate kinase [Anaerolineae bacterium]|nr:PfkB family carbohydrate kinase [Anaerolineae bacterium]